ncbi:MAG: hypothetical protein M8857_01450 [marine benthic group bacterium]|nr:hypothetical protein [Gemmatimonadota bacterium]
MVLTFDQALVPGATNVSNWSIRYQNQMYAVSSAIASGSQVDLVLTAPGPGFGPNYITYTAAALPRVIGNINLLDAPAFNQWNF